MKKSLVVIPFNVPWNWPADFQNQTAFELVKKGNVVICYLSCDKVYFKDSIASGAFPKWIKKISKNLYLFTPIFWIPFRKIKLVEKLNLLINLVCLRLVSEILNFIKSCENKIFWLFYPNQYCLRKYFRRSFFLLYDCVDFFPGLDESRLCKSADLVVANSHILLKHLSKHRSNVKLVPQGFRISDFTKKIHKKTSLCKLKKPVIGFVGGINKRLNFDLLLPLAKNNHDWNFVLWGPLQEKNKIDKKVRQKLQHLIRLPNVTTGESLNKSEIPGIVSSFDIGMIPYDTSQNFNKYCYPTKVFEYFYLGKPVISTRIIELARFPEFVKVGDDFESWQRIINDLISNRWEKKKMNMEKKLAEENSWGAKVSQVCKYISKDCS